jgi:hypothetical protein
MEYPKKNANAMKRSCYFQDAFLNGFADFAATCPKFEVDLRYPSCGKLWRYWIVILVWFSLVPHLAIAQAEHFAMLVTGTSGNDEFHDKFSKWSAQLIEILQKDLLFPRDHIHF